MVPISSMMTPILSYFDQKMGQKRAYFNRKGPSLNANISMMKQLFSILINLDKVAKSPDYQVTLFILTQS